MAIELPEPVSQFLNFIGIPWINVNEDKVRDFAQHVKQFGAELADTHGSATSTLTELSSGYQGAAYEALMKMWGDKSTSHIKELTEACDVLATALDGGADFIEAQKIACIAELVVLAAAFVADQAAAAVTFGLSEAALAAIEAAGRKLVEFLEQQLEQYIIGQITNAALQPLIGKIETMVEGLVFGDGGGAGAAGTSYQVDPDHLSTQAAAMSAHADAIRTTVSSFTSNVSGLDFES